MDRLQMVVGFLFHGTDVLLVQKTKPAWQAGLWNGVGGKMEGAETTMAAMNREFAEETSLHLINWKYVAMEMGPDYSTYFYSCVLPVTSMRPLVPSVNDAGERLAWRDTRFLPQLNVVGNLRWLVPLAQDWREMAAVIECKDDIKERASW